MNTSELLNKARNRTISRDEVAVVGDALRHGRPGVARYSLIHILGEAGAVEYEPLVSQFLQCRDDPMLARIALRSLCNYWGMTGRYITDVLRFANKVDWDVDDDVRIEALTTLGEWLRETKDTEAVNCLVRTVSGIAEEPIVRAVSYAAAARAVGVEWRDIPSTTQIVEEGMPDTTSVVALLQSRRAAT